MAESRKLYTIKSDENGEIKTSEEVVAIIAGLAATEVEGVKSLAGNITNELISRIGINHLDRGIQVITNEDGVSINTSIVISCGYNIPEISANVQDRIKSTIETMTGLQVNEINIRIAGVDMGDN